jgi:hypothetical protein
MGRCGMVTRRSIAAAHEINGKNRKALRSVKGISELMAVAESCLKDANQFFETHFSNYVSLKSAKSKDVPKSI